ncbi:hypothetical protein [Rufibacter sp. LB8]|uniref:hypothetical protein n=1 Tax=Rufibacter sp. LB8 TaxID=2777781 RepID=UPI00178C79F3|nr:hypothetical protein [Rufibacter sp. LB8]
MLYSKVEVKNESCLVAKAQEETVDQEEKFEHADQMVLSAQARLAALKEKYRQKLELEF